MAKVIVLEKSFINNTIVDAGTVIEDYEGEIGSNLKLAKGNDAAVKAESEAAAAAAATDEQSAALASQGQG